MGVLKSLHDELDAAVLQAYGWTDLNLPSDTDTLLVRLVELNSKRAAEEAAGTIRWLRPEFQNAGAGVQEAIDSETPSDDLDEEPEQIVVAKPTSQRPWASGISEQIKSVADVLSTSGRSLDLEEVASLKSPRFPAPVGNRGWGSACYRGEMARPG